MAAFRFARSGMTSTVLIMFGALGLVAYGCADPDGDMAVDGGTTSDGATPRPDATLPDSGAIAPDAGDAGQSQDAADATIVDGGGDADIDDASDGQAGDGDAGEAGPTLTELFTQEAAAAYCAQIATCCTTTIGDAGFDTERCKSDRLTGGLHAAVLPTSAQISQGDAILVTGGEADRQACVSALGALSCNQTGGEFVNVRNTCSRVFVGTVADGAACSSSTQCGQSSFCAIGGDGGAGLCTPLRIDADAGSNKCGDFGVHYAGPRTIGDPGFDLAIEPEINTAQEACSYRGKGNPAYYCEVWDTVDAVYRDLNDWVCLPATDNVGDECSVNAECASGMCDTTVTFLCLASTDWLTPTQCDNLRSVDDAGTD